jgi:SLOG family YspA-like protein
MIQIAHINGETWAFTGGRTFADQIMFDDVMVRLLDMFGCPAKVVHGMAKGLDTMAAEWADRMAIPSIGVPADWATHGKAAGPIRNEDILVKYKPKRLVAFPGGRGTADMVARAKKRGEDEIMVIEIKPTPALTAGKGAEK